MSDIFGDLREWGQVLKQIEQLRLAGQLDEHQEGLTRVLRYRYNWQLRQAALRAALDLKTPSEDLVDVLLGIVTDEYCDLETRLLACDAVRHSIRQLRAREGKEQLETRAIESVAKFLSVPQPPVLRVALGPVLTLLPKPAGAAH